MSKIQEVSKIEELKTQLSFYTGPDHMSPIWWKKLSVLTAETLIESIEKQTERKT